MVLGQRSAVSPEINNAFVATGTVHYLSVSGAHLGMLASVVWMIGLLAGVTRRTCAVWTMLVITAYAVLAEPNAPVWRSALTGNLLCLSILLRRPVRSLNWLALAAIILLAVQSTQLFDPGFQLSFLTVVALLHLHLRLRRSAYDLWNRFLGRDDPLLMPAVQDMLNPPGRLRRIVRVSARVVAECTLVSIAAWLGSAPLAAYHFHRVPLWGWFDTVIALPFIWLTQMVGFVKPLASWLVPPLGHWVATPLAYLTDALIAVVIWLSRIPGSGLATPAIPAWIVVAASAVLVLWIISERLQIRSHAVAIAALLLAVSAAWRLAPPAPGDTLRFRVLAVGHGAAHILTLPNARTLVYDMGSMPPYDLEQWAVGPVLARDRVARIDAAVVSHANLDHYCGLPDLAEHRPVGWLLSSPYLFRAAASPGATGRLVAEMCRLGVRMAVLSRGDRLAGTGDVNVDVLWPPEHLAATAEANDTSVVLRL
jgi:competence protein ComEC